jgi:hypothetical protein
MWTNKEYFCKCGNFLTGSLYVMSKTDNLHDHQESGRKTYATNNASTKFLPIYEPVFLLSFQFLNSVFFILNLA